MQDSYENLYIAASNKVETQLSKLNKRHYRYLVGPKAKDGSARKAESPTKTRSKIPKFAYLVEQAAFRKKAIKKLKRKKGAEGRAERKKEANLLKIKMQLEVFKTKPNPPKKPFSAKKPLPPKKTRTLKRGSLKVPFTRSIKRIGTNWLRLRAFELYRSTNLTAPYYYQLHRPVNLSRNFKPTTSRPRAARAGLESLQQNYPQAPRFTFRSIASTEEQPKYLRDFQRSAHSLELDFRSRHKYFKKLKAAKQNRVRPRSIILNQNIQNTLRDRPTALLRPALTNRLEAVTFKEFARLPSGTTPQGKGKVTEPARTTPLEAMSANLTFGKLGPPKYLVELGGELLNKYRPIRLIRAAYGPPTGQQVRTGRAAGVPDHYWQNTYPNIDIIRQINLHIAANTSKLSTTTLQTPPFLVGARPQPPLGKYSTVVKYRSVRISNPLLPPQQAVTTSPFTPPLNLRRRWLQDHAAHVTPQQSRWAARKTTGRLELSRRVEYPMQAWQKINQDAAAAGLRKGKKLRAIFPGHTVAPKGRTTLGFLAKSKRSHNLTSLTFVKNVQKADRRRAAAGVEFVGKYALPKNLKKATTTSKGRALQKPELEIELGRRRWAVKKKAKSLGQRSLARAKSFTAQTGQYRTSVTPLPKSFPTKGKPMGGPTTPLPAPDLLNRNTGKGSGEHPSTPQPPLNAFANKQTTLIGLGKHRSSKLSTDWASNRGEYNSVNPKWRKRRDGSDTRSEEPFKKRRPKFAVFRKWADRYESAARRQTHNYKTQPTYH